MGSALAVCLEKKNKCTYLHRQMNNEVIFCRDISERCRNGR